jgi:gamma-glutamyltranspeptidase/glutathione hydrolase
MFDATPSAAGSAGAVILADTASPMSVRGEQFWLDETRGGSAAAPAQRPRYTLTPESDPEGRQALHWRSGTPGGRQPGTNHPARPSSTSSSSGRTGIRTLHTAFAWPRFQTMHFYGSVWPHRAGFNRMNIEVPISKKCSTS